MRFTLEQGKNSPFRQDGRWDHQDSKTVRTSDHQERFAVAEVQLRDERQFHRGFMRGIRLHRNILEKIDLKMFEMRNV